MKQGQQSAERAGEQQQILFGFWVTPQFSETYTFSASVYGYLKVWVDGQVVVNTLDSDTATGMMPVAHHVAPRMRR